MEASERESVSLMKETRQAERNRLQESRRQLENEFRIAQGLAPLPEDEDIDNPDASDEDVEPVDVLLEESAQILYDLITPVRSTAQVSAVH